MYIFFSCADMDPSCFILGFLGASHRVEWRECGRESVSVSASASVSVSVSVGACVRTWEHASVERASEWGLKVKYERAWEGGGDGASMVGTRKLRYLGHWLLNFHVAEFGLLLLREHDLQTSGYCGVRRRLPYAVNGVRV